MSKLMQVSAVFLTVIVVQLIINLMFNGNIAWSVTSVARNQSKQADWLGVILPAEDVRRTRKEESSPFLGGGSYPVLFDKLTLLGAQILLHENIKSLSYKCRNMKRFGNKLDGGYEVCIDKDFVPQKNNCLVYSFGIRNEWSFDDAINKYYGCDVHSFDPSMGVEDHIHKQPNMFFHNLGIWGSNLRNSLNWELRDLATIVKDLKHENRDIDCLKVDVEGSEWPFIGHLLRSDVRRRVKQLVLELHTPRLNSDRQSMTVTDYGEIYHALSQLQRLGFRKFIYHSNNNCCGRFRELTPASVAGKRLCCYEVAYVNTRWRGYKDALVRRDNRTRLSISRAG